MEKVINAMPNNEEKVKAQTILEINENHPIVNKLKEDNVDAIYISDYDEIVDYLRKHVKENDIILTLGAGNVTKIAKKLIEDK